MTDREALRQGADNVLLTIIEPRRPQVICFHCAMDRTESVVEAVRGPDGKIAEYRCSLGHSMKVVKPKVADANR
jgi:hypothetical protein